MIPGNERERERERERRKAPSREMSLVTNRLKYLLSIAMPSKWLQIHFSHLDHVRFL
jgi:hypothetical protein